MFNRKQLADEHRQSLAQEQRKCCNVNINHSTRLENKQKAKVIYAGASSKKRDSLEGICKVVNKIDFCYDTTQRINLERYFKNNYMYHSLASESNHQEVD